MNQLIYLLETIVRDNDYAYKISPFVPYINASNFSKNSQALTTIYRIQEEDSLRKTAYLSWTKKTTRDEFIELAKRLGYDFTNFYIFKATFSNASDLNRAILIDIAEFTTHSVFNLLKKEIQDAIRYENEVISPLAATTNVSCIHISNFP